MNIIDERSSLGSAVKLPLEVPGGVSIEIEAPDLKSSRAAMRRLLAFSRTQ